MRFTVLALLLLIFSSINANSQVTDREGVNTIKKLPNGVVLLEDFEDVKVKRLPADWYSRDGSARPATYTGSLRDSYNYYVVKQGDNKFLRYAGTTAKHLNFPLVNKNVNIYETPVLSWKWRVWDLPDGASEDDENDTAASIYVVFGLGHVLWKEVPKSIRYTWSSTLPEGTVLSKFFDNQKVVVVESGDEGLGRWKTFEQNIVEDYKRLFGEPPPKTPLAILILSDGDSTGNTAIADYDDIKLKPAEE